MIAKMQSVIFLPVNAGRGIDSASSFPLRAHTYDCESNPCACLAAYPCTSECDNLGV